MEVIRPGSSSPSVRRMVSLPCQHSVPHCHTCNSLLSAVCQQSCVRIPTTHPLHKQCHVTFLMLTSLVSPLDTAYISCVYSLSLTITQSVLFSHCFLLSSSCYFFFFASLPLPFLTPFPFFPLPSPSPLSSPLPSVTLHSLGCSTRHPSRSRHPSLPLPPAYNGGTDCWSTQPARSTVPTMVYGKHAPLLR